MTKKKKIGILFIATGLLFMAAALSLTVYNYWDSSRAGKASQDVLTKLESALGELSKADNAIYQNEECEMPTIEIDGYRYIGIIEIPAINRYLPVMEEWDYTRLKYAPCRYYGSYFTNDMILAGHNYTKHFNELKYLEFGDDVYFTTVDGEVYHYTVSHIEILEPKQVSELKSGEWDLTMFSCDMGGQRRCTVRCVRID